MSRKKTSKTQKKSRLRWLWPSAVILFLLITLIAAGYTIFLSPGNMSSREPIISSFKNGQSTQFKEIIPKNNKKEVKQKPENHLAIIIDDMGEQYETGKALLGLDLPLSFAFLPFASHTEELLESARQHERDILLHLPMEPEDQNSNPGKGALYTSMSPARIKMTVAADLTAVPGAIGVNNHMGSRFTADREAMLPCLTFINTKGLFFIDSLTSKDSVAWSLARDSGLKTARRDIFLDNIKDVEEIKKNIFTLIETARKHGRSIGIAHPYKETLEALRQTREILQQKTNVVSVHEMVE